MVEDGTPAPLVFSLIQRLPEGSMTRSMQHDAEHWGEFLDVGRDYYVLAGLYDALNVNTAATGWFKKAPKFEPWPTPVRAVEKGRKRPKSVGDLMSMFGGPDRV